MRTGDSTGVMYRCNKIYSHPRVLTGGSLGLGPTPENIGLGRAKSRNQSTNEVNGSPPPPPARTRCYKVEVPVPLAPADSPANIWLPRPHGLPSRGGIRIWLWAQQLLLKTTARINVTRA